MKDIEKKNYTKELCKVVKRLMQRSTIEYSNLNKLKDYFSEQIIWVKDVNSPTEFIPKNNENGPSLRLRMNDFPDESLWTLVSGQHEESFDDIPNCWTINRKI